MKLANLSVQEVITRVSCLETESGITPELTTVLLQDPRKSVQTIGLRLQKKLQARQAEESRLNRMLCLERLLAAAGFPGVAGVDEAGRGPLAGPLVTAAVILPPRCHLPGLKDSKELSPAQRTALARSIRQQARAVAVSCVSVETIDRLNILGATFYGMKHCLQQLGRQCSFVLVDGFPIPGLALPQIPLVRGDAHCASIAAASIIAKVTRDRIMERLDRQYPQYGYAVHKGYPTAQHRQAIAQYGPSPVHRLSFNLLGEGYQ